MKIPTPTMPLVVPSRSSSIIISIITSIIISSRPLLDYLLVLQAIQLSAKWVAWIILEGKTHSECNRIICKVIKWEILAPHKICKVIQIWQIPIYSLDNSVTTILICTMVWTTNSLHRNCKTIQINSCLKDNHFLHKIKVYMIIWSIIRIQRWAAKWAVFWINKMWHLVFRVAVMLIM